MNIALCDDQEISLQLLYQKLQNLIQQENRRIIDVHCFSDSTLLLQQLKTVPFDIVFLDIDMPTLSGFSVAQIIQLNYPDILIVFVTFHTDLVFDSLKFRPFRFLRKHQLDLELSETFSALLKEYEHQHANYVFLSKSTIERIALIDIYYFEASMHKVHIVTRQGDYYQNTSLSRVEEQLHSSNFIRINSGILVNIQQIKFIKDSLLTLSNDVVLPISRRRLHHVKITMSSLLKKTSLRLI